MSNIPPPNPCIDCPHIHMLEEIEPPAKCNKTTDAYGRELMPSGQPISVQLTGPEEQIHAMLAALDEAGYRRFGPVLAAVPKKDDLSQDGIAARAMGMRAYQFVCGIPTKENKATPQPQEGLLQ